MGQANSRQEEFWEACGFGRPHIVRQMIKDGIDVNWRSYTHDCCPIHVASQGKPEIVSLLLAAKCDVNVKDIRENTALHHAAMKGHADIMETLVKAGTEIDAQDKNGWTALHNACYWCHPEAVRVLIKNGCNIHLTNKDNRTALHETARSKEADDRKLGDIARQLVKAGSDINAKGYDLGEVDFTSLMFSSYHGHPEVASCLLEAGCEVNTCGSNWWTALHWAADREQEELVYILLDAGADPTKKGTRGELAADRAKTDEMKEVLMNAVNLFQELQELEKNKSPASPSRLSRISYSSMSSLNHSPTKTGPHGLVEEGQFSPPRSPVKHSDLSNLIDKINKKSSKLQGITRHDKGESQTGAGNLASKPPPLPASDQSDSDVSPEVKDDENQTGEDNSQNSSVPLHDEPKTDVKSNKEVETSQSEGSEEKVLTDKLSAAAIDEQADIATPSAEAVAAATSASETASDTPFASNNDCEASADMMSATTVSPPDVSGSASPPPPADPQPTGKTETTI